MSKRRGSRVVSCGNDIFPKFRKFPSDHPTLRLLKIANQFVTDQVNVMLPPFRRNRRESIKTNRRQVVLENRNRGSRRRRRRYPDGTKSCGSFKKCMSGEREKSEKEIYIRRHDYE